MVKETKMISQSDVVNFFSNYEKTSFINIVTDTIVKMNKTNNPYFDKVKKHCSRNYYINSDYTKRVLENGRKEGINPEENTFQVQEMKGRKRVKNSVCIDNKTESIFYLFLEFFDEVKGSVKYTFEGNDIDKHVFQSYMVKVSENKSQPQERKVKVMTPKVENIKSFTIEGVKYIVQ
jgi:hypothetical protein